MTQPPSNTGQDLHAMLANDRLDLPVHDYQVLNQLLLRMHHGMDLQQTAYCLVNEGRKFLNCDRVSLLVLRGRKMKMIAISGVEAFDNRSPSLRTLSALSQRIANSGTALWYPQGADHLEDDLIELLNAYQDESHVRSIGVMPLRVPNQVDEGGPNSRDSSDRVIGTIVVEQFRDELAQEHCDKLELLSRHAVVAIDNTQRLESLPLRGLSEVLRTAVSQFSATRFPRTILFAAVLLGIVLSLTLVQVEMNISAPGILQANLRRNVFAPSDGVVTEVHVQSHSHVRQGDPLVTLRDPSLELEMQSVLGDLQTAQQRLSAVSTERIGKAASGRSSADGVPSRRTSEAEEIKRRITSFKQLLKILEQRREQLVIRSPLDGQVLTWDLENRLEDRPVSRGQLLLHVASDKGPWELEIEVDEKDIALVQAAREDTRKSLLVKYALATNPRSLEIGQLESVAASANVGVDGKNTVIVTVSTELESMDTIPGTSCTAWILCGRQSLGYVWFRDVIEATNRWFPAEIEETQ